MDLGCEGVLWALEARVWSALGEEEQGGGVGGRGERAGDGTGPIPAITTFSCRTKKTLKSLK